MLNSVLNYGGLEMMTKFGRTGFRADYKVSRNWKRKRKLWLQAYSLRNHGKEGRRKKRTLRMKLAGVTLGKRVAALKKPVSGSQTDIKCPKKMSLKHNYIETISFFEQVKAAFFKLKFATIVINHSHLKEVDPEVALMLVVEFSRFTDNAPRTKLVGRFGNDKSVMDVLIGCGYMGKFYTDYRKNKVFAGNRYYVNFKTGNLVTAPDVHQLMNAITEIHGENHFTKQGSKRIRTCLIELMENAVFHAYQITHLRRLSKLLSQKERWWMLGYYDSEVGEYYFALMDQGVGMVRTLEDNQRERTNRKNWLIPYSGSELVYMAFMQRMSSTRKKNRGLGLTKLRKYVEESKGAGELSVYTQKIQCVFSPASKGIHKKNNKSLDGTLIVWKIQNNDWISNDDLKNKPSK